MRRRFDSDMGYQLFTTMKKIKDYTKEQLQQIANTSNSRTAMLINMGYSPSGGTSKNALNQAISDLEIDITHFNSSPKFADSEIFCQNSKYTYRGKIKRKLLSMGVPYKCELCGNTGSWLGKPLTLQLEHKNGISNDNRLENLCFLCPNCHSQTDTYAGRNK